MERTILDVQYEIRVWELKRDNLRRELEAGAGCMSDIMLGGYRTVIADCVANIDGLRDELKGARPVDDPGAHSDVVDAVPVDTWRQSLREFFGYKVTDVQCEIL